MLHAELATSIPSRLKFLGSTNGFSKSSGMIQRWKSQPGMILKSKASCEHYAWVPMVALGVGIFYKNKIVSYCKDMSK